MRLSDLTGTNHRAGGVEILGIASDSRRVQPGFLFAALPGARADGAKFIADAIAHGAVAILASPEVPIGDESAVVVVDTNPRRRLAQIAARFYGDQPETVVAVTGTNGKTSIANFCLQIWTRLGRRAGSVGTLGVKGPAGDLPGALTTPDPIALHRSLHDLVEAGCSCVAIEASSHGLAQFRLDGVRLTAAAFTNLSRDHLDYHISEDAYFAAKLRLFTEVMAAGGIAVLNADSPRTPALRAACEARGNCVVTYGQAEEADLRLARFAPDPCGQSFDLAKSGRTTRVLLPLFGAFQALNAVCAAALVHVSGADWDAVVATLGHLSGIPGRLQHVVDLPGRAQVFVDYAHTPDALATVLKALRPHTKGKLAVVFGCGGDRDRGKRPEMGRVAAALADRVTVTDDNPRSEDARSIRAEVLAACPGAREIGDRGDAIHDAVGTLAPGDVLIVAGKGHETGQIVGGDVRPFEDAKVILKASCDLGRRRA